MPPPPKGSQKKKKKGHAPKHQNAFAFKHNPKSKLTEKILNSPNIHVCQRCYDKIEWRKQYRKYKPRTQPGVCNGCKKKNVLAAYHTICFKCSTESAKAKEVIRYETERIVKNQKEFDSSEGGSEAEEEKQQQYQGDEFAETPVCVPILRACAVCVKEIALPDPHEEENELDLIEGMGRIRLRERKARERKLAKGEKPGSGTGNDETTGRSVHEYDLESAGSSHVPNDGINDGEDDDGFDPEDPFLKAIGGADQLLTGEAYQQKLLQQEQKTTSS